MSTLFTEEIDKLFRSDDYVCVRVCVFYYVKASVCNQPLNQFAETKKPRREDFLKMVFWLLFECRDLGHPTDSKFIQI